MRLRQTVSHWFDVFDSTLRSLQVAFLCWLIITASSDGVFSRLLVFNGISCSAQATQCI